MEGGIKWAIWKLGRNENNNKSEIGERKKEMEGINKLIPGV